MSELERLGLICEALTFSQSARSAGSPSASHSRAVREAVFTLWESYGRSKHASARYRSRASLAADTRQGGLVYDHGIPFTLVHAELLAVEQPTPERVRPILERRLVAATITKEEDQRLTALGLRSRMPDSWDGQDPLARYAAAEIELVENKASSPRPRPSGGTAGSLGCSPKQAVAPPLTMRSPDDHPRLQAASSLVRSAWEHVWRGLQADGFELVPVATRDGFFVRRSSGAQFKVDPKVDTIRVKVGLRPRVAPPAELVHGGRQPDWLIVKPEQAALALDYLRQLGG